jgi:general secretion pathway protein G
MNNKGLTLIEVMVVVVILGVVAAVVAANVGGKVDPAKEKLTTTHLRVLKQEVELFKVDHGRFPERLEDLVHRPDFVEAKNWHEYRDEVPKDGWGRLYLYRVPGSRGKFDIISLGADGKESEDDLWSHPVTK